MSDQHQSDDVEEAIKPGTRLGRYEIRRLLGRGGMGCVYEGVHTELKKRVAIKTLHGSVAALPGARARFMREGEAASRIRHPNVVDITDVGSDAGITFLVMEYLEGEDLSALLARQGALEIAKAIDYMLPVIGAIAAAHEEGVIHRDLKPANVFLARTPHAGIQPMVLDFGISKLSGGGTGQTLALTGTGAAMGTPCYIAPEQIRSVSGVSARSDQYALGTILYECVTGRRAHDGETVFAILHSVGAGSFLRPRTVRPDIPMDLEEAVLRAMHLEPEDRFPNLKAFGEVLLPFASASARAQWAPIFADASTQEAPAPKVVGAGPAVGGTMILPPALAGGPAPTARPNTTGGTTTFGQTASQVTATDSSSRRGKIMGGALLGTAAAAAIVFVATRSPRAPVGAPSVTERTSEVATSAPPRPTNHPSSGIGPQLARYRAAVTAVPSSASFLLDGTTAGLGQLTRDFAIDGAEHTLIVSAPGFETATLRFRDQPPPSGVTLKPISQVRISAPHRSEHGEHHGTNHHTGTGRGKSPEAGAKNHSGRPLSSGANDAPILE
jgi:hypothetical protein